jgi:hypothetical protein
MRAVLTTGLLAALGAGLVPAGAGGAPATARWQLTLHGSILQQSERTTTTRSGDCAVTRTERTSERWQWSTTAPYAIGARRIAGGGAELLRGAQRGTIRVPVAATATAESTITATSSGPDGSCAPGFGSSSLCDEGRAAAVTVTLSWNARSGRLETGAPGTTPAVLRRRLGGCGAAPAGPQSPGERAFGLFAATRPVAAATLLAPGRTLTRQAGSVAQDGSGPAGERRTTRVTLRLAPVR